MNTCQTNIKYRYVIVVLLKPSSWVNQSNTRPPQVSHRTDEGVYVNRKNTDIPNT